MPRGRKNPDPKNVSDIDLLSLRPHFEAMAAREPSAGWNLSLVQIGRTIEALAAQHRDSVPTKQRTMLDKFVSETLDLIIFATSAARGSKETIALLSAFGSITDVDVLRASAAEIFVDENYRRQAAERVLEIISWLQKWAANRNVGRPIGTYTFAEIDSRLLRQVARRTSLLEAADQVTGPEIRAVVREAVASGILEKIARGNTAKENIDAHVRRLRRRIARLKP
jgi:hypothetical protein